MRSIKGHDKRDVAVRLLEAPVPVLRNFATDTVELCELTEWATCIAVMNKSVIKLMKNAPAGWLMCCWYKIACFYHFVSFR
jgi:hypothetical protein